MRSKVKPYDDWTKRNLIFNDKMGLIVKYPWITDEWIKDRETEFFSGGAPWMNKNRQYYSFFQIKFERTNMRTATGDEIEDGVFDVNMVAMSQNVLFVKLLELKAKQEEFNKYVDDLLGIPHPIHGRAPALKKKKDTLRPVKNFFDTFSLPIQFIRRGPYERDWDERLTKYYFALMAGDRYVPIVNFLKQKTGYGSK
jgi:hypothetical protein